MSMVPEEIAWVIPTVLPFIIGLIVGVIIKRAIKLILAIVVLFVVLVAIGYLQMPSMEELMKTALAYLPLIQSEAGPLINFIPYTSISFIIGLLIGLWKG
ncbi:MAG: hypothetical protein QXN08_08380 [Nitrososphaerales archaeon]